MIDIPRTKDELLRHHQAHCQTCWQNVDVLMRDGILPAYRIYEVVQYANYHGNLVRELVSGTHDACFPVVSLSSIVIGSGFFHENERYLVLYEKDGVTCLLQTDMTGVRAVNSCRLVNDHEERNGRPRKFYVAKAGR